MNDSLRRRLNFIGLILSLVAGLITWRLISLQFYVDSEIVNFLAAQALTEYRDQVMIHPPRGELYDRNGVLLATNAIEYEIGLSPVLILDREGTAKALAEATGLPEQELLADMATPDAQWVQLVPRAPAAMGQRVIELHLDGVIVNPLTRRYYPHGALASQVLGYVNLEGIGFYGIEGYYNDELEGEVGIEDQSRIPFEASYGEGWRNGSNLYLTLDSEIQYLTESTLEEAMRSTGATSGTIIVMDPRTGEILGMASRPTYDPNRYGLEDSALFADPAISHQYEPGSTVKVLTMAVALENGVVNADSTYEDNGVLEVGGIEVHNWDNAAHGTTTMTGLLAHSLNVGAATLALGTGPTRFYEGMELFGVGELTGIDLEGEIPGSMPEPGNEGWFDSALATHSFGQGLAMTPLQLITSVAAIANDGLIVQPHMVIRRQDADNTITTFGTTVVRRAISPETASALKEMMANALESEASPALVPGYRIAGKTGTAQIPIPGGYDPVQTIASFVGFGPVDDPRFIVLIKLDRPTSSEWGSQTAAPVFGQFVSRLVVLMEIPPDSVRQASAEAGR
jgi:cell division protein FtsI (penicillin-binding protein 3)